MANDLVAVESALWRRCSTAIWPACHPSLEWLANITKIPTNRRLKLVAKPQGDDDSVLRTSLRTAQDRSSARYLSGPAAPITL